MNRKRILALTLACATAFATLAPDTGILTAIVAQADDEPQQQEEKKALVASDFTGENITAAYGDTVSFDGITAPDGVSVTYKLSSSSETLTEVNDTTPAAGTYYIWANLTQATDTYKEGDSYTGKTYTVNKKDITADTTNAKASKAYDGNAFTATDIQGITLTGLVESDSSKVKVTPTITKNVDDTSVGEKSGIEISLALDNADEQDAAKNYNLTNATATINGEITAKALSGTVSVKKGDTAVENNTAITVGDSLTVDASALSTANDGATLAYQWLVGSEAAGDAAAGNTSYTVKAEDFGKTITVKVTDTSGNYSGELTSTATPTVTAKELNATAVTLTDNDLVYNGQASRENVPITLTDLPSDYQAFATVTFSAKDVGSAVSKIDTVKVYATTDTDKENEIKGYTATSDSLSTLVTSLSGKKITKKKLSANDIDKSSYTITKEYDGQALALTNATSNSNSLSITEGVVDSETVTISVTAATFAPDSSVADNKADDTNKNAGTYTATLTVSTSDTNYEFADDDNTITVAATITKKEDNSTIKVKVGDTESSHTVTYGQNDTANTYALTITGADSLTAFSGVTPTYTVNDATLAEVDGANLKVLKTGSITITATLENDNEKYTGTATLTVNAGTNPYTAKDVSVDNTNRTLTFTPEVADGAYAITDSNKVTYEYTFGGSNDWSNAGTIEVSGTDAVTIGEPNVPNLAVDANNILVRAKAIDGKYNAGTEKASTVALTVSKRDLTTDNITTYFALNQDNLTYDGNNRLSDIKGKVSVNSSYSDNLQSSAYDIIVKDADGNEYTESSSATPAGTYSVYIKIKADNTYLNTPADGTEPVLLGTVTVDKKATDLKATTTSLTKTYGDNEVADIAASDVCNISTDGDGEKSYASNNTDVVTIDNNGKMTIVGAGTAKITVSQAEGTNYAAATDVTITVTVNAKSIEEANVTIDGTFTYNAAAQEPEVVVNDSALNKTLVKDTDYTVAYSDNTNAGTAKVTITGKGNYSSSKKKDTNFTISALAIPDDAVLTLTGAGDFSVDGTVITAADASQVSITKVEYGSVDITDDVTIGTPTADNDGNYTLTIKVKDNDKNITLTDRNYTFAAPKSPSGGGGSGYSGGSGSGSGSSSNTPDKPDTPSEDPSDDPSTDPSQDPSTPPTTENPQPVADYTDATTGEVVVDKVIVPVSDEAGTTIEKQSDGTVTVTDSVLGTASHVSPAVFAEGGLYRLYNPNSGEHFYTKNPQEREALAQAGWSFESDQTTKMIASTEAGAKPVYRVYNPNTGLHHYTMNQAEANMLKSLGWDYEGISMYAYENGADDGNNVYRVYCPFQDANGNNQHVYTSSQTERDHLVSLGYIDEGVCWKTK